MPTAKSDLFEKELQDGAVLFKALGHPARLAILQFLAESNTCYTGDISKELPLARTTINQHLDELRKAGLIQGHYKGSKINYCLNPEVIIELRKMMELLLNSLNCCGPICCD